MRAVEFGVADRAAGIYGTTGMQLRFHLLSSTIHFRPLKPGAKLHTILFQICAHVCQVRDRTQIERFSTLHSCQLNHKDWLVNPMFLRILFTQYMYNWKKEEAKAKILYVNPIQNFKHIDTQRV